MINKIKCFLGLHEFIKQNPSERQCKHCHMFQKYVVYPFRSSVEYWETTKKQKQMVFKPKDGSGRFISKGDKLSVQNIKEPIEVYSKDDGQLYFTPYGKEELVNEYFSDDMNIID